MLDEVPSRSLPRAGAALPFCLLARPVVSVTGSPTMLVCHCHSVNCQRIRAEARDGARTVGQIGRRTQAGTSCGGCVPAIRDLLESSRRLPVVTASGALSADVALAAE